MGVGVHRSGREVHQFVGRATRWWVAAGLLAVACAGCLLFPAAVSAQVVSLPLLLPATVPQGFVLTGLDDTSAAPGRATYLMIDQAPDRSRRVISQSSVYGASAVDVVQGLWGDVVSGKSGDRRTTVHRHRAVAFGEDRVGWTVVWSEGSDLLSVDDVSRQASYASVMSIAARIRPTGLADGSFTMDVRPKGTVRLFAGSQERLASGEQYSLSYSSLEADLEVAVMDADPLMLQVVAGDAMVSDVTVRGRRGVLYNDGQALNLTWMEGPRTLVSVSSPDLNESGLRQVAESLAPVDAATFAAARSQARLALLPGSAVVQSAPLGSGALEGGSWVARPTSSPTGERCLTFDAPAVRVTACLQQSLTPTLTWVTGVVGDRRTVFGITSASVSTVVVSDRTGAVLGRASTTAAIGDGSIRLFAVQLGNPGVLTPVVDGAATVAGLDGSGAEVVPGRPVSALR